MARALRVVIGVLVGAIAGVVGCGGSVSTVPEGLRGENGTSGGPGGTTSSSGGGTTSSGGTPTCTTSNLPGDRACVPGTAKANAAITIDVDNTTEGCLGCFTTLEPCSAQVQGKKIRVGMKTKTCPPPGDQACPAVCLVPSGKCTIPPLEPGTYEVEVEGEPTRNGFRPRELVVSERGQATSCTLPRTPDPLPDTGFSTACQTDDDCRLATFGNLCQPCACPNDAIAKSASEAYEAAYRERASACVSAGPIACAGCAPVKAKCLPQPSGPASCVLQPGF